MDYYVTYSFFEGKGGVLMPVSGDGPSTLDLPIHYISLPNQTEKVMSSKAVNFFLFSPC